ncbi:MULTISPECIES: hypothetical protein [unclassified Rathayibacter]|uniref:hypothetical protein n=1 Tax=unclassified Rathayibacter TaxID=2609250 RepID=UPI00105C17B1|nr:MULTISPECIES: hypothetical protein [unclassified Rathayibacter]
MLDKQIAASGVSLGGRTIYELRNYLSHGGITPREQDLNFSLLLGLVEGIYSDLSLVINTSFAITHEVGSFPEVAFDGIGVVNPLIAVANGIIGFLQDVVNESGQIVVTYCILDQESPEMVQELSTEESTLLRSYVASNSPPQDPAVKYLRQSLIEDIRAFSEADSAITFDVASSISPVVVSWKRRTSEGFQDRVDIFRISSTDHARQWAKEGQQLEYSSYSNFLKEISNWDILVPRLVALLDNQITRKKAWDLQTFGQLSLDAAEIPAVPRVRELDARGESFRMRQTTGGDGLAERLDESVSEHSGVSQIFFFSGEAGVGKTHGLLEMTRARMLSVIGQNSDRPLFVYFDCANVRLSSIKEAIDAAVAGTFLLDADRIAALCRNGLMVLVIDGFDELLGGAGYSDALQTLKPILSRLRHRGTLLISARSSYLANQYRESLNRGENPLDTPEHLLLEMERWPGNVVESFFRESSEWSQYRSLLNAQDLDLLRLPFFARVFDSFVREAGDFNPARGRVDLVQMLLNAYIDRELEKIHQVTQGEVTNEQLRELLTESAGSMWVVGERELAQNDFLELAGVILDRDLLGGQYRYLGDRLTVLCGVAVSSGENEAVKFAFDHEKYFDALLVDYLWERYFSRADSESSATAFEKEVFAEAIFRSLTLRDPGNLMRTLGELGGSGVSLGSNISSNLGALACQLAAEEYWPNGGVALVGLQLNKLDFSRSALGSTQFSNCHIAELTVGSTTTGSLTLDQTHIDLLRVIRSGAAESPRLVFAADRGFDVGELHVLSEDGTSVVEVVVGRADVVDAVIGAGYLGLEALVESNTGMSELEEFAIEVLYRFVGRRAMTFVIEDRTSVPGQTASNWMPRANDSSWAQFVHSLVAADLARRSRITAAGPAKAQISFVVTPSLILGEETGDVRIADFWERIRD